MRGKENNRSTNNRPISASRSSGYGNSKTYKSGTQSQRGSISQNNNNNRGAANTFNNNKEMEGLRNENKRLNESNNAFQIKCEQLTTDHDELSTVAKDIEKK
eukprot:288765_1